MGKIYMNLLGRFCLTVAFYCLHTSGIAQNLQDPHVQIAANDNKAAQPITKSLKEILTELQRIYGIQFSFNTDIAQNLQLTAPASLEGAENVEELLTQILNPNGLKFKKVNGIYIIYKKDKNASPDESSSTTTDVQLRKINGKITNENSQALPGVSIVLQGSHTGTASDIEGEYSLNIPVNLENGSLIFSSIGYTSQEVKIDGQSVINMQLLPDVQSLEEIVVTGYATEQKKDIVGSVSVVKIEDLLSTPAGNVQPQLQGRAPGVTISANGSPGGTAKVRVRGFGSFGNSDPLYIIDGVPTFDVSNINPQDIESVQVLKDAASAAIYGARGANGVVIMTTKTGKPGPSTITFDSFYGVQNISKNRFPDLLNSQQLGELLWQSAINAGQTPSHAQYGSGPTPEIPDYTVAGSASGVFEGDPAIDPDQYNIDPNQGPVYQITKANKEGTHWFEEIFRTAPIQSHQVTATGGTEQGTYSLGLNYFDQQGIVRHTGYQRYTGRANTLFRIKKNIRLGENLQVSFEDLKGFGNDNNINSAGTQAVNTAFRTHPLIPVYDIMGNYAGTRGLGLGNSTNPIADLERASKNKNHVYRIFGNTFAEVDLLKNITVRSSFGMDYSSRYRNIITFRTWENSENFANNAYEERNVNTFNWTWTNTLNYAQTFADDHQVKILVGSEAIKSTSRTTGGRRIGYFSEDIDLLTLSTGSPVGQLTYSSGTRSTLYSLFGRIDYTFRDKYLLNATLRRDASSKFGQDARVAYFPAVGVGWRISSEPFLQHLSWLDDLKLRIGWGKIGNQNNVDPNNQYTFYRSQPGASFYDIAGTSNKLVTGFDIERIGNTQTQWETTTTTNVGVDLSILNSMLEVTLEVYQRNTEGLLVTQKPPLTGPDATYPHINIGTMKNTGVDLGITQRGHIHPDISYAATLTFTHYKNEATQISDNDHAFFSTGATNELDVTRTQKGYPISFFYGYVIDGFFNTQEEADTAPNQPLLKKMGGWKLKDVNGDGVVNAGDQTFIGSPHPAFQSGLNLSLAYKNFDFGTFLFWNHGNELYNSNRVWIDFNTFQGNRSKRMLYDSWRPDHQNAKLPVLNASDTQTNALPSDYYVEKGAYLRARNVQLGYTFPKKLISNVKIDHLRVYLQAQNLFTITQYSGIDPDIAIQQDDLAMGEDPAVYPNPRQYIIGVHLSF